MRAHKVKVTIPINHELAVRLPDDFPAGPAEVIVLAGSADERRTVKLAGVLAPDVPPPEDADPVADALAELRREREQRFDGARTGVEPPEGR